jgi:putative peptidoglycan lipid II flippase
MREPVAEPRHSERAVVRQSGLTGIAAAIGVACGLLLDITIAARFGASSTTDAFFVAARIPLALAAVVMVAANQALVPAFRTALTTRGAHATHRLVSMIVAVVVTMGAALVLVAWATAYPLMRVTAPGISGAEAANAVSMIPVLFAMVPLLAVFEVMRAYLNASYRFVLPALIYGINTAAAAMAVLIGPLVGWRHDIHLVAWAYLLGAAIQLVVIILAAIRCGLRLRLALDIRDPYLRGIGKLVVRPLTGAGLNPLCRVGEQVLVSFLPVGSITILNYGYRLISAIGGTVFFRSVIVALVPRLTEAHARNDQATFRRTTGTGLRIMLAISVPLTVFLAVLSQPAAQVVFHRGSLTRASAALLGAVLAVYSLSLVGSAVQRALLAPFFARLDTRTVLHNSLYGIVANLVLLPLLMVPFGFGNRNAILGVALSYSLAQLVNVTHAWSRLRLIVPRPAQGLSIFAMKVTGASLMSGTVMLAGTFLLRLYQPMGRVNLLLLTALVGLGGMAALSGAMALLTRTDLTAAWRILRRQPVGPAGAEMAGPAQSLMVPPRAETDAPGGASLGSEPAMSGGTV